MRLAGLKWGWMRYSFVGASALSTLCDSGIKSCKTFIRRFDPAPRLQRFSALVSANQHFPALIPVDFDRFQLISFNAVCPQSGAKVGMPLSRSP
jgi:hypothetical protein